MYKIALVEDEEQLRTNYARLLERKGYEVATFSNRVFASQAFKRRLPDMAILDVMLDEDRDGGFKLCQELRRLSPTIPIIFLTALNSDVDRVSGLRLGAWDYLIKNTTTSDYLPARISALFRIVESLKNPSIHAEHKMIGSLAIDESRKQTSWKDRPVILTLTEFLILQSLVKNPGHVKNYEQLMDAAGLGHVTNNSIAAHIRRIRGKFRDVDPEFNGIQSGYGMGYHWKVD